MHSGFTSMLYKRDFGKSMVRGKLNSLAKKSQAVHRCYFCTPIYHAILKCIAICIAIFSLIEYFNDFSSYFIDF